MTVRELSQSLFQLPEAWERFWFGLAPSRAVSTFRVALCTVAAIHFAMFLTWVPAWLSGDGWFDVATGRYVIGDGVPDTGSFYRWSPLFKATHPAAAYAVCGIGLAASVAAMMGLGSRMAPLGAWLCMLTIHHRAPWLSMPGEILLTAGLFYLLIDPGRTVWTLRPGFDDAAKRFSANLTLRCSQIHLLMWLVFSVISMLQYTVWWNGTAVSVLSQQIDGWLGEIPNSSQVGQFFTLAMLALQIAAAFFLTRRDFRVIGLGCLAGFATLVFVLAGDGLYGLVLLAMGTAFFPVDRSPNP